MKEMTLEERMDYAARRKSEMNCCQAVLVAFADRLGKDETELQLRELRPQRRPRRRRDMLMRKDISACYGHKSDGHRQFYGFTMPTNSMYTSFPTSSSLAFRSFAYFLCRN